jgi:hypothetical protein
MKRIERVFTDLQLNIFLKEKSALVGEICSMRAFLNWNTDETD